MPLLSSNWPQQSKGERGAEREKPNQDAGSPKLTKNLTGSTSASPRQTGRGMALGKKLLQD